MDLANAAEEESEIPDDPAESLQTDQQDAPRKRKKRKTPGKVPNEFDFWLTLEAWWNDCISKWGNSLDDSPEWKEFVVILLHQTTP